jgi:hypothetical protein
MQAQFFVALTTPWNAHDGPTPQIQADGTHYAAYFENERGAQLVFVYDPKVGEGRLWHSAIASVKPQAVVEGMVNGITLSALEQAWLTLCWKVATLDQAPSSDLLDQSAETCHSKEG